MKISDRLVSLNLVKQYVLFPSPRFTSRLVVFLSCFVFGPLGYFNERRVESGDECGFTAAEYNVMRDTSPIQAGIAGPQDNVNANDKFAR